MGRVVTEENGKFAVRSNVSEDEELVTPWFDTKEDLAQYLWENGDYTGQRPNSLEIANKFLEMGDVPTMMTKRIGRQIIVIESYNIAGEF